MTNEKDKIMIMLDGYIEQLMSGVQLATIERVSTGQDLTAEVTDLGAIGRLDRAEAILFNYR